MYDTYHKPDKQLEYIIIYSENNDRYIIES